MNLHYYEFALLCIINFHLFLFIGNGTGWINYYVRQNRNFMFVDFVGQKLKKAAPK